MKRPTISSCLAAVILVCLSGCSAAPSEPEVGVRPVNENISKEQQEALADGEVDREEYDAGFGRFQSCMDKIGYPLQGISETTMRIEYSYPSVADEHGAVDCYEEEFQQIDIRWQMRPEVQAKSESTMILRKCLSEIGVSPSDDPAQLHQQLMDNNVDISQCQ